MNVNKTGTLPKSPTDLLNTVDAFHTVGRAMFGDEWTGLELEPPNPGPDPAGVWSHMPGKNSQELPVQFARARTAGNTDLQREILNEWEARKACFGRWLKASQWLFDHALDGKLETVTRSKLGDEFVDAAPSVWGRDTFSLSNSVATRPWDVSRDPPGHGMIVTEYVFVRKASLSVLTAALDHGEVDQSLAENEHISRHLRFAMATANSLKLTAENQPSLPSMEVDLIDRYAKMFPGKTLSQTMAKAVARTIRHPDDAASERSRRLKK